MDIGQGLASFGQSVAGAMEDYHKKHVAYDEQLQLAQALSRIAISPQGQLTVIDPNAKDKAMQPVVDPKALEIFTAKTSADRERNLGSLQAITRIGANLVQHAAIAQMQTQTPLGREQLKAAQLANERMPVQAGNQQFNVSPTTALNATVEQPEREARTAHIKQQTATSEEQRQAAANQATVMMDIGGGNFARVPVNELIKHPEFLRDQSAKDLNNQVFASTGLSIPQIAQGWNKKIVNDQLTFEAPVVQQTIDPITQKPVPKYNADGTAAYELLPPDEKGERKTKTMRYQVPQEFTPDVLRLTGTEGVAGAERLKIPTPQDRSTKIVPNSAGVGTGPQPGDVRMINGVRAQWDGHGWVAIQ